MYFRHPNAGRLTRQYVTEIDDSSAAAGDGFWAEADTSLTGSATISLSGSGVLSENAWVAGFTLSILADGTLEQTPLVGNATVTITSEARFVPVFKGDATLSLTSEALLGQTPLASAPVISISATGILDDSSLQAASTIRISSSAILSVVSLVDVALTWPTRTLYATGEPSGATADLRWPSRTLVAYGGGAATLSWPVRVLTASGTIESIGTAALTWPVRVLSAEGLMSGVGTTELAWPSRYSTAYGGGSATLSWPVRTLTVGGTLEIIGTATLNWPTRTLAAEGLTGGIGAVALNWPIRTLTAEGLTGGVGTAVLTWPARILTAYGTGAVTETTYAVNLTTGSVAQLLLGVFDKLVTAHGRLYGLRSGALVRLDGDLDGAATIPATIRFAPQQFGTMQAKRLDGHVYLNLRENDGVTLTVVQDETTSWDYQTPADNSPGIGTHRVKVGRGITFHSLGLILKNRSGGRLDVGGLEIPVHPLSRKPR